MQTLACGVWRVYMTILEFSWSQETLWNNLERGEITWDVVECSRIWWNVPFHGEIVQLVHGGIFQNVVETSGMRWNLLECKRTYYHAPVYYRIFQNVVETSKTQYRQVTPHPVDTHIENHILPSLVERIGCMQGWRNFFGNKIKKILSPLHTPYWGEIFLWVTVWKSRVSSC